MELAGIHTPSAALFAGLVTSFHCAAMCGPLACWLRPVRPEDDATTIFATYQTARLVSYTVLGAAAGGLGQVPLGWIGAGVAHILAWALVAFFVIVGFRLDRRIKKPLVVIRAGLRLQQWARGKSATTAATVLGVGTPLLPCGPLYFVIALASLSGNAVRGAEFMLSFGLGTLPLLWIAQAHFSWLRGRLPAVWVGRLQAGLALTAALVIGWRLRQTLGFLGPSALNYICF